MPFWLLVYVSSFPPCSSRHRSPKSIEADAFFLFCNFVVLQCQLYATKGIESLSDIALVFDTEAGKIKILNEISVSVDTKLPAGVVLEIPGACELVLSKPRCQNLRRGAFLPFKSLFTICFAQCCFSPGTRLGV